MPTTVAGARRRRRCRCLDRRIVPATCAVPPSSAFVTRALTDRRHRQGPGGRDRHLRRWTMRGPAPEAVVDARHTHGVLPAARPPPPPLRLLAAAPITWSCSRWAMRRLLACILETPCAEAFTAKPRMVSVSEFHIVAGSLRRAVGLGLHIALGDEVGIEDADRIFDFRLGRRRLGIAGIGHAASRKRNEASTHCDRT